MANTASQAESQRDYVLGTHSDEAARLGLQHQLWSAFAHESWELAGIAPGMTVLDVGCGPGFGTFDLAQLVGPSGVVYAVDESAAYIDRLRDEAARRELMNIRPLVGDVQALESLDLPVAGLDAAYERWVLCFVPNPDRVVSGVARLLKPGGHFVANDYFNYESMTLAPREPVFSKIVAAVGASWRGRGGDPDIVARLPGLFERHGLRVRALDVAQRVARPPAGGAGASATMWAWPDSFFRLFVPSLVQMGVLTEQDHRDFLTMWERVSREPSCFMALPPVWRVIEVKA